MLERTDSPHAPWTVIRANDKRRGRIAVIQSVLGQLDYAGRSGPAIGEIDPAIALSARDFLKAGKPGW
jgi:hypothetical protein